MLVGDKLHDHEAATGPFLPAGSGLPRAVVGEGLFADHHDTLGDAFHGAAFNAVFGLRDGAVGVLGAFEEAGAVELAGLCCVEDVYDFSEAYGVSLQKKLIPERLISMAQSLQTAQSRNRVAARHSALRPPIPQMPQPRVCSSL